ncbi:MAG: hypothetical protein GY870_03520 [archaeon]|nr:hypothetical protein [archaeon]
MLIICPIAGVGSRLHSLTTTKPKAMIKIAGKRIMDHLMEKLKETFPKETKICFIVGYKKEDITSYLTANYSDYFELIYREQIPVGFKNNKPFYSGLGDAISLAGEFGREEDCFILLSDRLPIEKFTAMINKFNEASLDGIVNVKKVEDPSHYGVCTINSEGIVTEIVEKPSNPASDLAVSGAYIFSKRFTTKMFDYLDEQRKLTLQLGQEHQFTNIIQKILGDGAKIGVNIVQSPILDFGRINRLLKGNKYLLEEREKLNGNELNTMTIENLKNSVIIPPVFIGNNCDIKNSIIGPYVSIGDKTNLDHCILSNAVVGDEGTLKNVITEESVIADYVTIENLIKNKLTIGDSSILSSID